MDTQSFTAGQKISWLSFGKRIYGKVWKEWGPKEGEGYTSICAIAETVPHQGVHFHPRIIEDELKIEE